MTIASSVSGLCRRAAHGCLVLSLACAIVSNGSPAVAGTGDETIRIEPSGVSSWRTMVSSGSLALRGGGDEAFSVPNMPMPLGKQLAPGSRLPTVRTGPSVSGDYAVATPLAGATVTSGFPALGDDNTRFPPDTNGAVGPFHVMTMLNTEVRVQMRDGMVEETVGLATFWTAGTGLTGTPFDPRLQYDSADGRWIATVDADAASATSAIWFAISETADPTGNWTFYAFDADSSDTNWADFPGFGSNANWIAIVNNMFAIEDPAPTGVGFKGVKMWVIGKSSALAGGALDVTVFDTGFAHLPAGCEPFVSGCELWSFSMMPAVAPGDDGRMYLVDSSGFAFVGLPPLFRLTEIDGTQASPTWSATADAAGPSPGSGLFQAVDDFSFSMPDAEQPGSGLGADAGDIRVSANSVYRNGRVWFTHAGGLPLQGADRTAVFWYEIDPLLLNSTGVPILQSGIVDGGPGLHHIYPSIAVNSRNDACLGFSRSSSAIFLEGVVVGRAAGDPLGTLGPLEIVKAGEATYLKQGNGDRIRWGDYSATVVDPVDDLSFWTIQEYAETDVGPGPGDDRWGTWWAYKEVLPLTTTTTMNTVTTTSTSTSTSMSTTTTTVLIDACGDPVPDAGVALGGGALVTASDGLFVLRAAVGSSICELCVCDVDDSGAITASDSLAVLQFAVGVDVTLSCPVCAAPGS